MCVRACLSVCACLSRSACVLTSILSRACLLCICVCREMCLGVRVVDGVCVCACVCVCLCVGGWVCVVCVCMCVHVYDFMCIFAHPKQSWACSSFPCTGCWVTEYLDLSWSSAASMCVQAGFVSANLAQALLVPFGKLHRALIGLLKYHTPTVEQKGGYLSGAAARGR